MTVNQNCTFCAHRDGRNVGESQILFFGDYDSSDGAGGLVLEDVTVFSEKNVWHRFYGNHQLH